MRRKGKAVIWIEYLIARAIFGALGSLPRRAAVGLGIRIGRLGFLVLPHLRKVALKNLDIAFPEMEDAAKTAIATGTFENLGRVLGEASKYMSVSRESLEEMVDFRLGDELREVYENTGPGGRGVLITTGHMGNWELLVLAFAAVYKPMSYLARPLDNPKIEDFTYRLRTRFGNQPLNKTNSARTAISILKDGGILGALVDVNAHPKEGVFVPFFGLESCTTSGAATIALRSNALILPAFCVWDRDAERFRFVHGPVMEPIRTGDRKADIVATTAAFTAEIEKIIRRYPDQWMWIHKRWKTRPPGEPPIY
ncbi:MAG TPA: lysophospholipid acyltransferase family protein [Pyrinomonadaceae bacterium]|nr:lysophospholipid acyltransferase family protein [Pyrinomonadaceae bacterium]HMP66980.1 lysophospholipid acyltransferase family protein [Pyrinomonadaceae bacterium]